MLNGNMLFYFWEEFFINLCIIISLTILYIPLRTKLKIAVRPFWQKGIIDGLACGLASILFMLFAIEAAENAFVDLRFIPIMLVILLNGFFPALIAGVIMIAGRFVIGGMSSFSVSELLIILALIAGFQLIQKRYQPDHRKITYQKASIMIFYANIVFAIFMMFDFSHHYVYLTRVLPAYLLISFAGGLTALFFTNYLEKIEKLLSTYKEEVSTDFLTGLHNMRSFEATWKEAMDKAVSSNEKLTILSLDIDYFKAFNDTYGHPAGDQLLIEFSTILSRNIRSMDTAFRHGGDEFLIVLPNCSITNGLEVAERIKQEVEGNPFYIPNKHHIHVTVSIGAATYPDTCSSHQHIIHQADDALYKAKHSGKNQVFTVAESSPIESS